MYDIDSAVQDSVKMCGIAPVWCAGCIEHVHMHRSTCSTLTHQALIHLY